MSLNVFYHFRKVVVSFDQGIGFPYTKMAKMVMHLLEDSIDKDLWDDSGFIFLAIFPVYVVYSKPVSSYPYESFSWNLLLGSSINLSILMQCLSGCCKAFHVSQFNVTQ